jgi:hypothetical protein
MTTYTYRPNSFAKKRFGLTQSLYSGSSLTQLIQDAIGEENSNAHVIDQDPFYDDRTTNSISAILNREAFSASYDANPHLMVKDLPVRPIYASIGMIRKIN